MVWLIFTLLCIGNLSAQFLDITGNPEPELEQRLFRLLERLQKEKLFDTLLLYGEDCVFHSLSRRLQVPTVLVSSGSTNFEWNFSSLTLILSCDFQAEREESYRTLIKLQMNRRLILLRGDIQPESVCDFYSKKEQYNIAMVRDNLDQFGVVYSCRLFQDLNYEKVNLLEGNPIFIEQFRNMQGAKIRTLSDLTAPRCMLYRDPKSGEEKYVGFVANLINHFVEKVNATMDMQEHLVEAGKEMSLVNITNWASQDLLDIGMTWALTYKKKSFDTISYPYFLSSYCLMVPLPDEMPLMQIYMAIVDPIVLIVFLLIFCIFSVMQIYLQKKSLSLSSVLMNDICMRGLLAQSFPFPRFSSRKLKLIFTILCFYSVITTTMYIAYLQAFLYTPPVDPYMTSFTDLQKSRYTAAIPFYDEEILEALNISKDKMLVLDPKRFEHLRGTFNDNFVYPVTEVHWMTFNEQQNTFGNPLFYYSRALCLNYLDILSFPIRRHLPYRDLFEEHMLRQKEFGLTNHLIDRGFLDMWKLNLTSPKDFIRPLPNDSIEVHNLYYIFGMYIAGMGAALCCFIVEIWSPLSCFRRLKLRIQN
ncbi:uncharacterized protein [Drosophila takahashii]|uniref:uncharacterized protein n=1 Tax=Drosophila takahashii TaxID=29030 RepID=UPI001CF82439|nr:uncharacterized protein LOC108054359 [Drosophila takahashii]